MSSNSGTCCDVTAVQDDLIKIVSISCFGTAKPETTIISTKLRKVYSKGFYYFLSAPNQINSGTVKLVNTEEDAPKNGVC